MVKHNSQAKFALEFYLNCPSNLSLKKEWRVRKQDSQNGDSPCAVFHPSLPLPVVLHPAGYGLRHFSSDITCRAKHVGAQLLIPATSPLAWVPSRLCKHAEGAPPTPNYHNGLDFAWL